ncbi:hypothetical protein F5Y17DRAFT_418174 [Xylariaceae sp. FL0594]|nr:hypothetical protein F5Y17DRAFT_418174 [Xylariaceae sp. FL0594]
MKAVFSAVILAAAGVANALVKLTNSDYSGIEAGKTFKITWSDAAGPVTLTLKNGPTTDLKDVETITSGATGSSFSWTVDPTLPDGEYAIEIDDGEEPNYSPQFEISGGVSATTSSSTTTVSITSSTTLSSTSTTTESTITSTTSTESSTTSSAESTTTTTTASSSSSTETSATKTTSTHTSTTSVPVETTTPPHSDGYSIAAPIIPGMLAALGALLL